MQDAVLVRVAGMHVCGLRQWHRQAGSFGEAGGAAYGDREVRCRKHVGRMLHVRDDTAARCRRVFSLG